MMKEQTYRIHPGGLSACDTIMEHGVMLPCHPTMSREDCNYVYEVIAEFATSAGQI